MDNSLKIGAVSGLIAGIIGGIIGLISAMMQFSIGIQYFFLAPPPETPIIDIAVREIIINVIWGIVLGIIYSRIYDLILGRSWIKGIYYGVVLWILFNLRTAFIVGMYGLYMWSIIWMFMFTLIIYGLVLGILYEKLGSKYIEVKEKVEKGKFDIMKGVQAGAIAGFAYGVVVFLTMTVSAYIGIFGQLPGTAESPYLTDIGFMLNQLGSHAVVNLFWGAVFGVFYAIFYDRIPKEGILKGLCFALIIYFITSFRASVYFFAYGHIISSMNWFIAGILPVIVYGFVLGLLYRKPSD